MIKTKNTKTNIQTAPAASTSKRTEEKVAHKRQSSKNEAAQSRGAQLQTKCEVTFAIYEPQAEEVLVSGAFNNWQPTPLARRANRDWLTTLTLEPGRYEYKFLVDGKWKIDPRAHQVSPNGFGTLNSVIEVKA